MLLGWGLCPEVNITAFYQKSEKGTDAARPAEEQPKQAANPTYPLIHISFYLSSLLVSSMSAAACPSPTWKCGAVLLPQSVLEGMKGENPRGGVMQDNLFLIKRLVWTLVYLLLMFLFAEAQAPEPKTTIVSIYGKVFLPDRQPAPFMPLHLSTSGGYSADTTIDGDGNYRFDEFPQAQIQFKVTPPAESPYYDAPVIYNITREGQNTLRANIYITQSKAVIVKKEGTEQAISVKELSQHVPSAAQKAYQNGKKHRGQKKFKEAMNELNRAIQLYPEYFQAITEKGYVLANTGHPQEALTEFNKALQIFSSYEPALSGAGFCMLSTDKYEQAIGMLEQAIQIETTHTQNLLFLGIANIALTRWSKAQEALEQALKRDPEGMTNAHLYLAYALAGQELYSRAVDELHKYLKLIPNAPHADHLRDLEALWRSKTPPELK
jgi:tetratricopeptide (TPR) repeat protein